MNQSKVGNYPNQYVNIETEQWEGYVDRVGKEVFDVIFVDNFGNYSIPTFRVTFSFARHPEIKKTDIQEGTVIHWIKTKHLENKNIFEKSNLQIQKQPNITESDMRIAREKAEKLLKDFERFGMEDVS